MNILQHIYFCIYTEFLLGVCLLVKSLGFKVCLCLAPQDNEKLSSKMVARILLAEATYKSIVNPHTFQRLVLNGISLCT